MIEDNPIYKDMVYIVFLLTILQTIIDQYIKFLNDKFRELELGRYQNNMKDIFDILIEKGNPKLAIRYAKRIIEENKGRMPADIAPGTKVYELVEKLGKHLPEKVRINFL